jgi:hypothetical protein
MAGWLQGEDPGTDFRGAGFLALQCHLYMAVQEPDLFAALRWKRAGQRSEWEYPFAVAGVNVAFMLAGACERQPFTQAEPRWSRAAKCFKCRSDLLAERLGRLPHEAMELSAPLAFETSHVRVLLRASGSAGGGQNTRHTGWHRFLAAAGESQGLSSNQDAPWWNILAAWTAHVQRAWYEHLARPSVYARHTCTFGGRFRGRLEARAAAPAPADSASSWKAAARQAPHGRSLF